MPVTALALSGESHFELGVTAKEPYGSVVVRDSHSRQLLHSQWVGFHRRRKRAIKDLRLALELGLAHPTTGERVELCPNALRVAEHCLLKFDNDIGGMFAAQGDIAKALELSRQKVNKHLGTLVEAGIFTSEPRNREGVYAQRAHMGGRTTNRYRFCWDRILAAIKDARRTLRKYTSKVPFWADNMAGHRREAKPEPSLADLIRKRHGDAAADAYLARVTTVEPPDWGNPTTKEVGRLVESGSHESPAVEAGEARPEAPQTHRRSFLRRVSRGVGARLTRLSHRTRVLFRKASS
jgi:hypothetical protein